MMMLIRNTNYNHKNRGFKRARGRTSENNFGHVEAVRREAAESESVSNAETAEGDNVNHTILTPTSDHDWFLRFFV